MSFSEIFIKRPIATSLIGIAILLSGIISFCFLPASPLPQIEFPTIMIKASLPGASPEVMASSVATPIEKELSRIAGITEMTSSSSLGTTKIIIQFDLSRNINGAARDVESAINASLGDLPSNLPSKPNYQKVNPADSPVIILALSSESYRIDELYDYASTHLQQKLLQLDGVGQIIIGGSSLPAVRVDVNPNKLSNYNLGLTDISKAIGSANITIANGNIETNDSSYNIEFQSEITKAKDYSKIILFTKDNHILRLADVANVSDSVQDIRNFGSLNGNQTVAIIVFKQPGVNIIDTVDNIYASIPSLKKMIPQNVNIDVVMDRTTTIRAALFDVEKTLILSMILVVIVVYYFLRNARAMIIPSCALILSLFGTLTIMKILGFSLNNLSLMALTIATGFVVDDAIVVLENISRHLEKGMKPLEAAIKGSKEIIFTITSITLSLIAVFIPMLCMGGMVGRLFREFAVTLATSIVISLIISITFIPMISAIFLKHQKEEPKKDVLRGFYEKTLKIALSHPKKVLAITLGVFVLNISLFKHISKGFFPQQDTGIIISSLVADQNTSFINLKNNFDIFIDIIKKDPAVQNVFGFIGSSGNNNTTNSGSIYIILKPLEERKISVYQIIDRLRNKVKDIPSSTLYCQAVQDLVVGGRQGNAQFQYSISSDNVEDVNKITPFIMQEIASLPGITDVSSDQKNHGLKAFVHINYEKAAIYGLTNQEIDNSLYNAFGQSLVSIIYKDLNQYYVVLEVSEEYLKDPKYLSQVYVKAANGNLVPLSSVASFEIGSELLGVNHQGLSPSATISFNLLPNVPLGNVVDLVNNKIDELNLPASIQSSFKGAAQAFQSSISGEVYLIVGALLAVYIILGMLYESLIHPVTIISSLPSAGVGALIALYFTRTDLTIIAMIAIILLIGIVKKNAIMMIDFVLETQRVNNISPEEAVYEAAVIRFRPIMMTTMAALLGAVPLAFGSGVGSELRKPLGIAIIGGLIFSQILTLYTTPIIYLWMERASNYFKHKKMEQK